MILQRFVTVAGEGDGGLDGCDGVVLIEGAVLPLLDRLMFDGDAGGTADVA